MKTSGFVYFFNELKQHFVSVWSLILGITVALLTIFSFSKAYYGHMISVGIIPQTIGFVLIFLGFFDLIYGVYQAQILNSYQFTLVGKERAISSLIGSVVCYSLSFYAIPLLPFSVVCGIYQVRFSLWLLYAGNMLIQWLVLSLLFSAVGVFLGSMTKHRQAYIYATLFYLPFTPLADTLFFELYHASDIQFYNWISLFNVTLSTPYAFYYNLFAGTLNKAFLSKYGFIFCFALLIGSLLYLLKRHILPKIKWLACGIAVIVCCVIAGLIFSYNNAIPQFYDFYNGDKINYGIKTAEQCDYVVQSHTLTVDLNHDLQAQSTLQLTDIQTDRLRLKLDETLVVHSLSLNGIATNFVREGDWITIPVLNQTETVVTMTYSGRPNYEDSLRGRSIFIDQSCCYLPECFAWYPQDPNAGYNTNINLTVQTNNKLITNLNGNKLCREKEFQCSGYAKQIYIVTGPLGEATYDGISVIGYEPFVQNVSRISNRLDKDINAFCTESIASVPLLNPHIVDQFENIDVAYETLGRNDIKTILYLPFTYGIAGTYYRFDNTVICSEVSLSYAK